MNIIHQMPKLGTSTLAEMETFVLKSLQNKYPSSVAVNRDLKTPGQDLFKMFRPCYIRAFKDVACCAKRDDKSTKGIKSANKEDGFIDRSHFRLFCAYVCIYASMVNQ